MIEVKAALPHGQFEKWVKREFPHWKNRSTSQNYMKITRELNADYNRHLASLPSQYTAMYALAKIVTNQDDTTKEAILEQV